MAAVGVSNSSGWVSGSGLAGARSVALRRPLLLSAVGDSHTANSTLFGDGTVAWALRGLGGAVALLNNHALSGAGLESSWPSASGGQIGALLGGSLLPDVVYLAIGANNRTSDSAGALLEKYRSYCDALRMRLLSRGKVGLLFHRTPLPTRTLDGGLRQLENDWNWSVRDGMRGYAEQNGDLWFDPYSTPGLTEGPAGNPVGVAALYGDQYHPNAAGGRLIGIAARESMLPLLVYPYLTLPPAFTPRARVAASGNGGTTDAIDARDGYDLNNLLRTGRFSDANATRLVGGSGVALDRFVAFWEDQPTNGVYSRPSADVVRVTMQPGASPIRNWCQFEVRDTVASHSFDSFSPGDVILALHRFSLSGMSGSGGDLRVVEQYWETGSLGGASTTNTYALDREDSPAIYGGWTTVAAVRTVPASRQSLRLFIGTTAMSAASGRFDLGPQALYNMTQMGWI